MIRGYLIKLLLNLVAKDWFRFNDIGYEEYYETWEELHQTKFQNVRERELGKLYVEAANPSLDEKERWLKWGRIIQINIDINKLENSRENLRLAKGEFKNENVKVNQVKQLYEKTNKFIRNFNITK